MVYGKMTLTVSVPTDATTETLALLEANFKYQLERFVEYGSLLFTDCKGDKLQVDVHNVDNIELDEFVAV